MTRTEELMKLAEAAYTSADDLEEFHYKTNPPTIKQLVELSLAQNEALKMYVERGYCYPFPSIAAFNKFEGGK